MILLAIIFRGHLLNNCLVKCVDDSLASSPGRVKERLSILHMVL